MIACFDSYQVAAVITLPAVAAALAEGGCRTSVPALAIEINW